MHSVHIDDTEFGWIQINGKKYEHDVIILVNGDIKKRKKKLSKAVYRTSHKLSLDEAKFIREKGAKRIIIGSGQFGQLRLSDEAERYFDRKKITVKILSTPEAVKFWNKSEESAVGLFHVTC
jgi:hypothetical protein